MLRKGVIAGPDEKNPGGYAPGIFLVKLRVVIP
jgi:hypothetical protein